MSIKYWIWAKVLPFAINKKCPARIPRSGKAGTQVDCLTVYINKGENPYFLLDGMNEGALVGRIWDGSSYSIQERIEIEQIGNGIEINFYNGMYEYSYKNLLSYIFFYIIPTHRIYTIIEIIKDYFIQWHNNIKRVESLRRYDLLKALLYHFPAGQEFSSTLVMTKFYTWRVLRRPDYLDKSKIMSIQLEWLVQINELKKTQDGNYVISGKLWETISNYESEFLRESNEKKHRNWIMILTIVLAISALVQAKIIIIPIILEVQSWDALLSYFNNFIQAALKLIISN